MMADHAHISPGLTTPEHARNRQSTLYAATISTGVVALLVVALRLLARKLSRAKFWFDDCLIVLALFNLGAIVYVAVWSIQDGLGLPYLATGNDSVHKVLKRTFYAEFLYTTLLCLVKYSILAFYWRTFSIQRIRVAVGVLTCAVTGYTIGVICTYLLQCRPVAQFWLREDSWACPVDEKTFMIWSALPNIATDVGLLILPIFPIWNLKKNTKQKVALSIVFGLGSITLFASIARLIAAAKADFVALNISWTLVDFLLWSIVEAATALIAANLPFLRPLYAALADKTQQARRSWTFRKSSTRSSRYTISSPRSVQESELKTRTWSNSGGSYQSDHECEITLVPIEMLAEYEQLDDCLNSPTMGIVPENFQLRDLEKVVIRSEARGYIWQ